MVNLRAVIDALHAQGELSDSDYQKGLVRMGTEGEKSPHYPIPSLESDLFCHANVLDVLAEAGILPVASVPFGFMSTQGNQSHQCGTAILQPNACEVLEWRSSAYRKTGSGHCRSCVHSDACDGDIPVR